MINIPFEAFTKIPRLRRGCVITEKIDGTNAQIYIPELPFEGELATLPFLVGSRNRWITRDQDNYGFANWAYSNVDELLKLGPGHHYGEWWGAGIQRRYGLSEKRFSLFNVGRWKDVQLPAGVSLVPTIYDGIFSDWAITDALDKLRNEGSLAAPGFMQPEGIIIYHSASRQLFKVTLEKDAEHKGKQ